MKKISSILLLSAAAFSFASCSYNVSEAFYRLMKVEKRSSSLSILNDEPVINSISENEEYDVLIIADLHYGCENRKGNGERKDDEWFNQLLATDENGKIPVDDVRFVVCLGDVADHGIKSEFETYKENILDKFKSIKTAKAPDGIPVYNILGNHDLYNSGWFEWVEYCYPGTSYYKFDTPSFSWYFLDSASGNLGIYQYESLNEEMEKSNKKNLVFSHVPVYANDYKFYTMQNTEERNKLLGTLAKYKTQQFIDGHTHDEIVSDLNKFTEYNLPGFLQRYGYAVLHVNEETDTLNFEYKYFAEN